MHTPPTHRLWNVDGEAPAQTTPDGRFLVFSTATDLTAPEDTSTVSQVFRYDAETGELTRVSVGQRVHYECPATKAIEEALQLRRQHGHASGSLSEVLPPGDRWRSPKMAPMIVFQSADGLTPGALNGQEESIVRGEW